MKKIYPVILCGGFGIRMWPLSRLDLPKQFLKLNSRASSLQDTMMRFVSERFHPTLLVANQQYKDLIIQQLQEVEIYNSVLLLENESRNTAIASLMAALHILQTASSDEMMLFSVADQFISEKDVCKLMSNLDFISHHISDNIIVFATSPDDRNSEYGCIEKTSDMIAEGIYKINIWHHQSSKRVSQNNLMSCNILWHMGVTVATVDSYIKIFQEYEPLLFQYCWNLYRNTESCFIKNNKHYSLRYINYEIKKENAEPSLKMYSSIPEIQMEEVLSRNANNVCVFQADIKWQDVGALLQLIKNQISIDHKQNHIKGDVMQLDCIDSDIINQGHFLVAIGLSNLLLVNTEDALLIASKTHLHLLKNAMLNLKNEQRKELFAIEQIKPWGKAKVIYARQRYKIKIIQIEPGEQISVQKHMMREEHWFIINGRGAVFKNGVCQMVQNGDYIHIAKCDIHCIKNIASDISLQFIEIQIGEVLQEDDIQRFYDKYDRD